jgi:predicted DCC family thiol-disulfide oxidoreductase YuxK
MFNEKNSVLIYDGDCGFCNESLNFAYSKFKTMPAVRPFQEGGYLEYGLTLEKVENSIYLCQKDSGELPLRGHAAIAEILSWQSNRLYLFLGKMMSLKILSPGFRLGYSLVAKYRRYLPGGTKTCGIKQAKTES